MVPPEWSRAKRPLLDSTANHNTDVLTTMANELENHGKNSLVIVDSLSDLLVRSSIRKEDVVTIVKGLRRRAKDWKGTIYLMLTKSVSEPWIEEALKDSVDAVLQFEWVSNPHKSSRLRAMWIEKSMPLLAYMRPEQQGRFIIQVDPNKGLVTTQYERID
jgi:archaellum biogenesis ATPase FlaH